MIGEDWVLLEGRACEIAREEAQLDLQQAHEKETVNYYLQSLRKRGHVGLANAGLMVQEMLFPLGARQRVKNEVRHLHPEYHCFLEAGKDPLPSDREGTDTERQQSPWCTRGHFAVATFLHSRVFRTA